MAKGEELLKQADVKWNLVKQCSIFPHGKSKTLKMVENKYKKAWRQLDIESKAKGAK